MTKFLQTALTTAPINHSHEQQSFFSSLTAFENFLPLVILLAIALIWGAHIWSIHKNFGKLRKTLAVVGTVVITSLIFGCTLFISNNTKNDELASHVEEFGYVENSVSRYNDITSKRLKIKYGVTTSNPTWKIEDNNVKELPYPEINDQVEVILENGKKAMVSHDEIPFEATLTIDGEELPFTDDYKKAMKLKSESEELLKESNRILEITKEIEEF